MTTTPSQSKSPTNYKPKAGGEVLEAIRQTKENGSIRELDNPGALSAQLVLIARQYSGVDQAPSDTVKECIRMIRSQFGLLGLHEIRIAFQKWSTGEYGELKAAESYGKFTVRHVGAVLSAYVEKTRKEALRDYYAEQEKTRQQKDEQRKAEQRAEYDRTFAAMIQEADVKNWKDVQVQWYDTLIRLNLMPEPAPTMKKEYVQSARIEYFENLDQQPAFNSDPFRALREKKFREETQESQIVSIAKKMIVADWLNPITQSETDEDIPL